MAMVLLPFLLLAGGRVGCHENTCCSAIPTVDARYAATCIKLSPGGLPGAMIIFLTPAWRRLRSTRWSASLSQQIAISVDAAASRNAALRMPVVEKSSLQRLS